MGRMRLRLACWQKIMPRKSCPQIGFPPSGCILDRFMPRSAALPGARSFHASWSGDRMKPLKSLSSSPLWSRNGIFKFGAGGQNRNLFIQTQSTPNPMSLMFYPGKPVMEAGSADFPNARAAMTSPLAKALFHIDGVIRVFYGSDFVTVTKADESSWDVLKPEIFASIMDFYASNQPLFEDSMSMVHSDTAIQEDDNETVAMIKELLETRIRPAVQDDGGDIEYHGFDADTGMVKLKMQGACSGCPSSSVTLKSGIENMLMHYIPEIKGVEEVHDSSFSDEEDAKTSQDNFQQAVPLKLEHIDCH